MRVRKCFSRMLETERNAFIAALLQMKNTTANPLEPDVNKHISIYDQFVLIHNAADAQIQLGGATAVDPAHQGSAFGPWHREFLLRFELELQKFDPMVMLPYWDWTDTVGNANIVFDELGMGPDGDPTNFDQIPLGYFSTEKPNTGSNTTPLPPWYPVSMNGWHCDPRLVISTSFNNLRRNIGAFTSLASQTDVATTLTVAPGANNAATYMNFRDALETDPLMHNDTHNWFGLGAHMRNPSQSPNDPMFFLHHCNCDRLWAMWQMDGHAGNSYYQVSGGFQGHNLAQPMWPWIGGLPGYTSSYVSGNLVIPDFTAETPRTAADVINHREIVLNGTNVGYSYDSQVVVGIALDRTGSMTGPTPDPLTGMPPNITKWEASKMGVGHFLQDAEAAYQAAESYVIGGVNTFRSAGGINEVEPIASVATKYGLIKNGSPYAQAAFNADIAGVVPQGGTPLAAAITETEDNLIRPPFNNKPDNDQRYMCILTDGIETSTPLLSTIGSEELEDTIIFGLGFGLGSGWNGVDYGTIASMVSKGKTAPIDVEQTFHGENMNVINNFFSKSIAHTLGFSPATDPSYEVFPGEMIMTPFEVNCTDQVFMISLQGYDFNDKNWTFHLLGPNNTMYMESVEHPFKITWVQRNARATIFLNRNHGPITMWAGTWQVKAVYKRNKERSFMYMASEWELLIPSGAAPILGPNYSRLDSPAAKRTPVRLMQPKPGKRHPNARGFNTGTPATLSVNIYVKGQTSVEISCETKRPFAGNPIELAIKINDIGKGSIKSMRAIGRMIAPNFSLGNIMLDFETIPKGKRKMYYHKIEGETKFDMLGYVKDYEKLKPQVFEYIDEVIDFQKADDGIWKATIKNTPYPGSYKFGILVEGTILRPDGCLDRIWRILNTEAALGIRPTVEHSKPRLEWIKPNKIVIRLTPIDKYGNIAVPISSTSIELLYNRRTIAFVQNKRDDGVIELETQIEAKNVKYNEAKNCYDKTIILADNCGHKIEVKPNTPLHFSVRIGSTILPVTNK